MAYHYRGKARYHDSGDGHASEATAALAEDVDFIGKQLLNLMTNLNGTKNSNSKPHNTQTEIFLPSRIDEDRIKPRQSPPIQIFSVYTVFRTTELLEQILIALPPPQIVFCRAVNKKFKDVVDGSISVKRALFLTPILNQDPADCPILNSFLKGIASKHKYLRTSKTSFKILGLSLMEPKPDQHHGRVYVGLELEYIEDTPRYVSVPWVNMVICQPSVEIEVVWKNSFHGLESRHTVNTTTLGEVIGISAEDIKQDVEEHRRRTEERNINERKRIEELNLNQRRRTKERYTNRRGHHRLGFG